MHYSAFINLIVTVFHSKALKFAFFILCVEKTESLYFRVRFLDQIMQFVKHTLLCFTGEK